jgi:hypothetical protein
LHAVDIAFEIIQRFGNGWLAGFSQALFTRCIDDFLHPVLEQERLPAKAFVFETGMLFSPQGFQ